MRIRFFPWKGQLTLMLFFPLFIFPFIFSSCNRSSEELPLAPPVTHPLTREYIGYGVVNASFSHLLNEPGPGGVSQAFLRRGTLVRIVERRTIMNRGNSESWVLVEGNYDNPGSTSRGWLEEITVEIYDNESRARTASRIMSP